MSDQSSNSQVNITSDGNLTGDDISAQKVKAEGDSAISDVIQAGVSGQVSGGVHIGDKIYTGSDLEEPSDCLARAVAAYEARLYQLVARSAVPPDHPYKFLRAFETEGADIFFGRDAASEELYRTALNARSGAGKTSLPNAGLSPRLIREGRLPVYARVYESPLGGGTGGSSEECWHMGGAFYA